MGNRSFFNALHDREGDFLLATVLEGPAQGERVLLRNTAPVWPEKLPAFWGEHLPALAAVTSSGILKSAGHRIFVERFGAAPQLVVCGGGHVGASVVRLAKLLGLPVTALEDRPEFAEELRQAGADAVLCLPFTEGLAQIPGGQETYFVVVTRAHSCDIACLRSILQDKESAKSLTKILLTASGGPFFGMKTEELRGKTKADALKHPNWNMGAKITIDSATLMNKGLELIEAVWLFGLPPEKIQIVVQRQSIVHSAVQYSDNSIIAQLGVPDMRIPIQYALTYPARVPGVVPELDFTTLKLLTFDVADEETFRCLAACKKAIKKGGLGPCAANGANEEAVKLFLEDKIGFLDIGRLVEAVVDSDSFGGDYTLADVYECDKMARAFVRAHL